MTIASCYFYPFQIILKTKVLEELEVSFLMIELTKWRAFPGEMQSSFAWLCVEIQFDIGKFMLAVLIRK